MRLRRFPPCAHLSFRSLSLSPPQPYLRIPNRLQTRATVLQAANYTPATILSCHVNVRAQNCWITPVRNLPPNKIPLCPSRKRNDPRVSTNESGDIKSINCRFRRVKARKCSFIASIQRFQSVIVYPGGEIFFYQGVKI